ncbi:MULTISPECIES: DMT family transporter [unclassified Halomonas]|uniref:DMT family transporter n=1 Tax=unclassified Halomonas TaxID=2609666 RepID=UPI0028838A4C|nr:MULTISPECIES: DMT family transporter [unclassified Halomonas]MDT0501414.1 DMT family transporter [Halomonas sp. PAR7]MDT0512912.1 DMT family transporter [Halomonas sp. LES1]MDT0591263.1 DMT family transporter [Halomonas sp. PAR8]
MQLQRPHLTHSPWLGGGAAALAVLLWALVPLLANQAGDLPPLRLSALALLAGALGTLPMARRRRHRDVPLRPVEGVVVYLGVPLLTAGAVGACFAAFNRAPAEQVALILYTWPVLFLLASQWRALGRLPGNCLLGTSLAFSGAALLVGPQALSGGASGSWVGYLLAALGALCWALYSLAGQVAAWRLGDRMPHLLLIASLLTGGASLALEGTIALPARDTLVIVVALGLGPYGLAMLAWDRAMRDPLAHRVGNLAHGVPVVATLFLVLAGVSVPDWRLPLAAVLVVAGSVVAAAEPKRVAPSFSRRAFRRS